MKYNIKLYSLIGLSLLVGFFVGFFLFSNIYVIGKSSNVLNTENVESSINYINFKEINNFEKDSINFIGGKTLNNKFVYIEKNYFNQLTQHKFESHAMKKNQNSAQVILVGCHCMKIEGNYYFIVGDCDCKAGYCDYQQNYFCETGNIM